MERARTSASRSLLSSRGSFLPQLLSSHKCTKSEAPSSSDMPAAEPQAPNTSRVSMHLCIRGSCVEAGVAEAAVQCHPDGRGADRASGGQGGERRRLVARRALSFAQGCPRTPCRTEIQLQELSPAEHSGQQAQLAISCRPGRLQAHRRLCRARGCSARRRACLADEGTLGTGGKLGQVKRGDSSASQ